MVFPSCILHEGVLLASLLSLFVPHEKGMHPLIAQRAQLIYLSLHSKAHVTCMPMYSSTDTLYAAAPDSGRASQGQLLLEDVKDRPLDGYGTTGQPDGRLLEWPYTGKNALYYGRDAVALSDAEKSMQVQVGSPDPSSVSRAAL